MLFAAQNNETASRPVDSRDRLTGWRDIAAYVGRSARTAQRWEKICSLPVHRITTPNGEVVYSFRTELDEWRRSRDTKAAGEQNLSPPVEARRAGQRRTLLLGSLLGVGISVVVVAIVLVAEPYVTPVRSIMRAVGPAKSGPGPSGWRVEDGRLKVYGARDERLWEYQFPFALDERAYAKVEGTAPSLVAIADLEGDGAKELLFVARARDPIDAALFCFDAGGHVRFSVQPRHRVRYGDQEYAPPFEVQQIFLTPESNRSYTLWLVAGHHAWFPTVLEKLTHSGDVVTEYWNDGRIDALREATIGSRRVILVAGNNVEFAGPSLTVLDYDMPGGSASADAARFRCEDCGGNAPVASIVIPFTSLWSELNLAPKVDDLMLSKNGYITLALHGSRPADAGAHRRLDMLAIFDQRFEIIDVQVTETGASPSLRTTSNGSTPRLARLQMFPVLRWLNGRRVGPDPAPAR